MPPNHIIGHWKETTVGTLGAFNSRLLAYPTNPLVGTGGSVTRSSRFPTLESSGINVLSSPEERAKEPDLNVGRGLLIDETLFGNHGTYRRNIRRIRSEVTRSFSTIFASRSF